MTADNIASIPEEEKYFSDSQQQQPDYNCKEQTLYKPFIRPTIAKNNNKQFNSSLSLNNTTSSRPKLHTLRSSDTSRFPTLERLENSMLLPKSSKITIEPVTFPGEPNTTTSTSAISNSKKLGSQVRCIFIF